MSQELLITEKVQYNKRKISRSSHNIYLEVPCHGYSPLLSRDSNYNNNNNNNNNGRQRSSSMTTSPVKLPHTNKNRRRRSLSPRLTAKSNSNILETIQRRSSVNSITTNRQLSPKPIAKKLNILVIGGENAGKSCLAEFLNGSSLSSSSSDDDDWGSTSTTSNSPRDVNIRVHNDPFGLSHVYKYDLVLLIYSVTDSATFKYIKSLINVTTNLNQKPVILVGNKIDLVRARVVSTSDGHRLASENNLKFIETSALLNLNLSELLSGIKAQINCREINLQSSNKRKVNLFDKIAGLLSYGRMSRSCLDLHTL